MKADVGLLWLEKACSLLQPRPRPAAAIQLLSRDASELASGCDPVFSLGDETLVDRVMRKFLLDK
jgi:hypothetical protein